MTNFPSITPKPDMPIISGSEIDEFNLCAMRHWFKFGLGLQPENLSDALQIGIAGHAVLAEYLRRRATGDTFIMAASYCFEVLDRLEGIDPKNVAEVNKLVLHYLKRYKNEPWEILAVERKYYWEVPGHNYAFGLTLDALIRYTGGPLEGSIAIYDWKFTSNFWSFWKFRMYVQLKRYKYILEKLGQPIDELVVAQIRTRSNASDKFKHQHHEKEDMTPLELDLIMREATRTADLIFRLKELGLTDWKKNIRRTLNTSVCDRCPVASLCKLDMQGKDMTREAGMRYRKTDYGYN